MNIIVDGYGLISYDKIKHERHGNKHRYYPIGCKLIANKKGDTKYFGPYPSQPGGFYDSFIDDGRICFLDKEPMGKDDKPIIDRLQDNFDYSQEIPAYKSYEYWPARKDCLDDQLMKFDNVDQALLWFECMYEPEDDFGYY